MKNTLLSGALEKNAEPQVQRRRLLQTALAVTAGGGLQSLASADAFAAEWSSGAVAAFAASGESSTPHSSGMDSSMRGAFKACLDCHSMCLQMAMRYCLERGGRHVEQKHLRLMLNCAEICQTSANFMLSGSPLHGRVCAVWRRGVRGVRQELRAGGRHARVRRRMPTLRKELQSDDMNPRRRFLKANAAAGAGTALTRCPQPTLGRHWQARRPCWIAPGGNLNKSQSLL